MHTAFRFVNILDWKAYPWLLESMDTAGDRLYIGTNKGQLLVHRVSGENIDTRKAFSKKEKPITQILVFEKIGVMLWCSDGYVSISDLRSLELITRIEKSKGCSFFAAELQIRGDPVTDSHRQSLGAEIDAHDCVLKIAVFGIGKKVITFEYQMGAPYVVDGKEITLSSAPQTAVWCGRNICLGFKKEYVMLEEETGRTSELFKSGPSGETSCIRVPGNELLINTDNISVFVNLLGKPTRKYGINWSERPIELGYSAPYVLAIQAKTVEVRNAESVAYVQNIDFKQAKFIASDKCLFIATCNACWRLDQLPITEQIDELMINEEFSEAISLSEYLSGDIKTKLEMQETIKRMQAFNLFQRRNYEESMKIFSNIDIHPQNVIGLYTTLMDSDTRIRTNYLYPFGVQPLPSNDLESAIKALINYLTTKRSELSKLTNIGDETQRIKRQSLSEIIDTTLLKCYLEVKPSMVASLLRVNNNCAILESELALKMKNAIPDLVTLYKSRRMHFQALDLLNKQRDIPGPLFGVGPTVEYLQQLGPENIDLILEFSKWVLKIDRNAGFAIFAADDYPNLKELNQDKVYEHLKANAPDLVIQYLEHCVFVWSQSSSIFHNRLVQAYFDEIAIPMQEYISSLRGAIPPSPGKEPGNLGERRLRLLQFLTASSANYTPQTLLSKLLSLDGMFEEKAILLGRIGQHEKALSIYVSNLKNPKLAEDYCMRTYEKDKENSRDVYLALLKIYLKPGEVNEEAALNILHHHYQKIDTVKALSIIPATTPVAKLKEFLCAVIGERSRSKRDVQLLKSIHKSMQFQVRQELLQYSERRTLIDFDVCCYICHKPIGIKAFLTFPNGIIVDLNCHRDPKLCPCSNARCSLIHKT